MCCARQQGKAANAVQKAKGGKKLKTKGWGSTSSSDASAKKAKPQRILRFSVKRPDFLGGGTSELGSVPKDVADSLAPLYDRSVLTLFG